MKLLVVAVSLCLLVASPAARAGGLGERVFGRTVVTEKVDGAERERTTQHFGGDGRLRRTEIDQRSGRTGVRRVKTERFRRDGSLASRTIDTRVARDGGGADHDVWHQGFGRDGHVTIDLTLGQVEGKISAYLLAGMRRFGTRAEIHWDKANQKLRYAPGK